MDATGMPLQKKVFVVLGLSRTGTSAITRGLKVLNVNFGETLLPADSRNPKGFWEDAEVLYKVNRNVAAALENPWVTVGRLTDAYIENNPTLKSIAQIAQKLLQERLANTNSWAFKDPRTVTILPFWQYVFQEMPVQDHYVIAVRNPLAAAQSNLAFCGTDIETGLILWLVHLIPAIEGTDQRKRVIISYEQMLQYPELQLQRMQHAFGLGDTLDAKELAAYTNDFLDKKLRHHIASDAEYEKHPAFDIVPLCKQAYNLFMRLAKDELQFDTPQFKTEWQAIKDEFERMYPMYVYVHNLKKQIAEQKREIRTIHKSLPWKLTYPLRLVDDLLRNRRRRIRKQKRLTREYA